MSHTHNWELNFEHELGKYGILPDAGNPATPSARIHAAPGFQRNAGSFNPPSFSRAANGAAAQASPGNRSAVIRFAQQHRLVVIDNTSKISGALWVIHNKTNDAIARQLEIYGMKYASSKGWWMN
jgi:hypothetical protein